MRAISCSVFHGRKHFYKRNEGFLAVIDVMIVGSAIKTLIVVGSLFALFRSKAIHEGRAHFTGPLHCNHYMTRSMLVVSSVRSTRRSLVGRVRAVVTETLALSLFAILAQIIIFTLDAFIADTSDWSLLSHARFASGSVAEYAGMNPRIGTDYLFELVMPTVRVLRV